MALVIETNNGKFKQVNKGVDIYRSSWLVSTSTTQFAHGLGSAPDSVELFYDDNGSIIKAEDGHISSVDSTNININFEGLTIDATHKLRIIAYLV